MSWIIFLSYSNRIRSRLNPNISYWFRRSAANPDRDKECDEEILHWLHSTPHNCQVKNRLIWVGGVTWFLVIFKFSFCKQLIDRNLFKWVNAQKLQTSVQIARQFEILVKDSKNEINSKGNPDLSFYGVETIAIKMLDSKILFYQHPNASYKAWQWDFCRELKVVCEEDKIAFVFSVIKSNSTQLSWLIFTSFWKSQFSNLITTNAGRIIV